MTPQKVASLLDQAFLNQQAVSQLHLEKDFSLKDAYSIQRQLVNHRLGRGASISGVKMGFTSEAKRVQMGVDDVIWGRLTDEMEIAEGGNLDLKKFIHPRVEPEIAFLINRKVDHPVNLDNVLEIIDGIALALEVIDSRYENFKFSLEDVVADNCSSAAYAIGQWAPKDLIDQIETISLRIDDQPIHDGLASSIMGNPLQSLVDAVRLSLENGLVLEKASVVLAGAVTPAVYLKANQKIVCHSELLPEVSLNT